MKEYALYLPDILIEKAFDIISIFNFKNLKIFTTSIYYNNIKIHNDDIAKILKLLKARTIKGIIIYDSNSMSKKSVNKIKLYCHKYNCKLFLIENYVY